jgi:hypothetical protein
MIVAMLIVYPEAQTGAFFTSKLAIMKPLILKKWDDSQDASGIYSISHAVSIEKYKKMRKAGRAETDTQNTLNAINSCIGEDNYREFLYALADIIKHLGLDLFTVKVTGMEYPSNYMFLAIGIESDETHRVLFN